MRDLIKAQIKMFGMTAAEVDGEIEGFTEGGVVSQDEANLMYAMCVLSDVQHVMNGDKEAARQWINKAKYAIAQTKSSIRKTN